MIDFRLQNLVMTVDKIKYCLGSQSYPPFDILDAEGIVAHLWSRKEHSIRSQLFDLYKHNPTICGLLMQETDDLAEARKKLLEVRDALRNISTDQWITQGVSDLLHLIAYTKLFVVEKRYKSFNCSPVAIRQCEINDKFSDCLLYTSDAADE